MTSPSEGGGPLTWARPYVFAGIGLAFILAALFPRTVFRGEVLLPAGLLFDYPPWSEYPIDDRPVAKNQQAIESFLMFNMFYAATDLALTKGEWPLWNPLEFGGMPLLANYQSAVLYPPRLLHAVFDRYIATTLFVLLKLWLCGFNAYICARVFGLRALNAMIPAVAWMLSGYNTTWAYWADPDVAAWLPLQLAAAELLARGYLRRGWALMAMSSTLMLLGGHPESAFTMSAGTGIFFFVRIAALGKRVWKPLLMAAAAWAFAIALTAPQTLPFIEYLPESQTFGSRADQGTHDLHFFPGSAWIAFFVPRFFGTNIDSNFWTTSAENQNYIIMAYAGVSIWVLAVCALVSWGRTQRGLLFALLAPALVSVALALDLPWLRSMHRLPLLESVWGCWYLGFPMFVLAMLAGFGWQRILDKKITRRGAGILALIFLVSVPIGVATYSFYHPLLEAENVLPFVNIQVAVACAVVLGTMVMAMLGGLRGRQRVLTFVLIGLVSADLIWAARDVHPTSPRRQVLFKTNLTNVLSQVPDRVHAVPAGIPTGLLQGYGIEQLWGYDGIMPARWWRLLAETETSLLERMAGVRHVLTKADAEPKGLPIDGVGLHERADALPRAFLSRSIVQMENEVAIFARMREPDFDPEREVLTTAPLSGTPSATTDALGLAELVSRTPNRVVVDIAANEACVLVLSDAFYPGWVVTIDGEPGEVFPAYYAFRGVAVPTGAHRVVFSYEPWPFRIGLRISLAAIAISLAVSGVFLLGRRTR